MSDATDGRTCRTCGVWKSFTAFHKHARGPGGRRPHCQECQNKKNRDDYAKDRTPFLARIARRLAKDPDAHRRDSLTWVKLNKERSRANNAAYRLANPDHMTDLRRAWRINNPEAAREGLRRYRARLWNAPVVDLTAAEINSLMAAWGWRCAYCGKRFSRLDLDHIVPVSQGGSHTLSNVRPACRRCNAKKGDGPAPVPFQPDPCIEPFGKHGHPLSRARKASGRGAASRP